MIFLKHFLNESYKGLSSIWKKVNKFKGMIIDLEKEFEQLILST